MDCKLPPLIWHKQMAPALSRVEWLGEGDFCTCYLVNGSHVLRLARHAKASAALRQEMSLLPRLKEELDVRIPEIVATGSRSDTGEAFIFYPLVPGTILEAAAVASLSAACRSELARRMAEFIARLHQFPLAAARACGLRETPPRQYLPALLEGARGALSACLPPDIWRYYVRIVERYLATPEVHRYTPSLLHGDLSPDHFLGDAGRCTLTGVIDFGDSLIGDPCRDLIFILEDYGEEMLELVLSFYAPSGRRQDAARRVRLFQQMNNLEYGMAQLAAGEPEALRLALETLITQATRESLL